MLPELLQLLATNLRERRQVCFFETGRVFHPTGALLPDEPRRLAIVMAGDREPFSWHTPDPPAIDFFDLKGVLEALLRRLNVETRVEWAAAADARFHPGRSAELRLADGAATPSSPSLQEGGVLGIAGELHPEVRDRLGMGVSRACAAELDLDVLLRLPEPAHYRPVVRQPATYQDIAVIAALDIPAERIRAMIEANAGPLLERVELFDIYSGPPILAGQRSLAFRMTFRAPDLTLEDAEVSKVRERIARRLESDLGVTIRG
jgi:phenylalanyl-tRNA synthetase beta chain